MRRKRALAFGIVALAAWAGEFLFVLANSLAFGSLAKGLVWSSSFLTDWTGILIAFVATSVAFERPHLSSPRAVALATTAGFLVALMFAGLGGWAQLGVSTLLSASSLLAHVVTPVTLFFAWLFVFEHGELRWRDALRFALFPVAYLIQMLIRGALGGGYPYPQVDVGRVGLSSALVFSAGVILLFLLIGLLVVGFDRGMARAGAFRADEAR